MLSWIFVSAVVLFNGAMARSVSAISHERYGMMDDLPGKRSATTADVATTVAVVIVIAVIVIIYCMIFCVGGITAFCFVQGKRTRNRSGEPTGFVVRETPIIDHVPISARHRQPADVSSRRSSGSGVATACAPRSRRASRGGSRSRGRSKAGGRGKRVQRKQQPYSPVIRAEDLPPRESEGGEGGGGGVDHLPAAKPASTEHAPPCDRSPYGTTRQASPLVANVPHSRLPPAAVASLPPTAPIPPNISPTDCQPLAAYSSNGGDSSNGPHSSDGAPSSNMGVLVPPGTALPLGVYSPLAPHSPMGASLQHGPRSPKGGYMPAGIAARCAPCSPKGLQSSPWSTSSPRGPASPKGAQSYVGVASRAGCLSPKGARTPVGEPSPHILPRDPCHSPGRGKSSRRAPHGGEQDI